MEIIKLSFKANFFKYGGHVYKQFKEIPMGSPSSVVIAEIVMQNIEKSIFQSINHLFWFRYVYNIIIRRQQNGSLEFKVFRKNIHTDRYLNFNSYHPTKYKRSTARSLFCRANKICDERFYVGRK